MAQHRTKEEYIEASLKAIEEYKLFFVTDVPTYIGISEARFYQLELEKVEPIKEALIKNRVDIKVGLRKKWWESDNTTAQILLFKLVASEEERKRVSQQYTDLTTGGDKVETVNRFSRMTDDELAKLGKELSHLMAEDKDETESDTQEQPIT